MQLTRTLGAEWIRHGVNVNSVAPCDFATPMIAPFLDQRSYRDWIVDAIPAGRVGQPREIVGAVLYLASPASDMMAGHNLLMLCQNSLKVNRHPYPGAPYALIKGTSCPAVWTFRERLSLVPEAPWPEVAKIA